MESGFTPKRVDTQVFNNAIDDIADEVQDQWDERRKSLRYLR